MEETGNVNNVNVWPQQNPSASVFTDWKGDQYVSPNIQNQEHKHFCPMRFTRIINPFSRSHLSEEPPAQHASFSMTNNGFPALSAEAQRQESSDTCRTERNWEYASKIKWISKNWSSSVPKHSLWSLPPSHNASLSLCLRNSFHFPSVGCWQRQVYQPPKSNSLQTQSSGECCHKAELWAHVCTAAWERGGRGGEFGRLWLGLGDCPHNGEDRTGWEMDWGWTWWP